MSPQLPLTIFKAVSSAVEQRVTRTGDKRFGGLKISVKVTRYSSLRCVWNISYCQLKVPDSCCKTISRFCGVRDHPSNIYYTGCAHKLSSMASKHLLLIGSIALVICLVEACGVILSLTLVRKLTHLGDWIFDIIWSFTREVPTKNLLLVLSQFLRLFLRKAEMETKNC